MEELDPFLEEQLRSADIEVDGGQELLPRFGELDPALVARALHAAGVPGVSAHLLVPAKDPVQGLPVRPPTLCPGCGHRGVFTVLSRMKVFVSGDIGCYTLGAMPPFNAVNSDVCMGASISTAHGIQKAPVDLALDKRNRKVSVIGDSTFFHSGITGLLNIVWNGGTSVVIILDNRTTAMTGGQDTPGTGHTLCGLEAPALEIADLCRTLGVPRVEVVDPYDLTQVERAVTEAIEAQEPAVIVAKRPAFSSAASGARPGRWTRRSATAASAACGWGARLSAWWPAATATTRARWPSTHRSAPAAASAPRWADSKNEAEGAGFEHARVLTPCRLSRMAGDCP